MQSKFGHLLAETLEAQGLCLQAIEDLSSGKYSMSTICQYIKDGVLPHPGTAERIANDFYLYFSVPTESWIRALHFDYNERRVPGGKDVVIVKVRDIFGRLEVLNNSGSQCFVSCSCGTTLYVERSSLTSGLTKSCGCLNKEMLKARASTRQLPSLNQFKPPEGSRWVKAVGVRFEPFSSTSTGRCVWWSALCSCGTVANVRDYSLRGKKATLSCGCLARELASNKRKNLYSGVDVLSTITWPKSSKWDQALKWEMRLNGYDNNSKLWVLMLCFCGVERWTTATTVKAGTSKSCGCYAREQSSIQGVKNGKATRGNRRPQVSPETIDWLEGSRWVKAVRTEKRTATNKGGRGTRTWVLMLCSCGIEKWVQAPQIRNGHTKSCGCLAKEHTKAMGKRNKK